MRFSFAFIKNSAVFKAYLILHFIQKHVLPCWEQWLWGPGYGGTVEALVLLHFMREVLLMQWGVCWSTVGPPRSPLALCFFLTGLTQGGSWGAGQQSPGSVCASLLLLGCQQGLFHHPSGCNSTAALCRSHYTNIKEALHPRSLKLLKIHICLRFATPRNFGFVEQILEFLCSKTQRK